MSLFQSIYVFLGFSTFSISLAILQCIGLCCYMRIQDLPMIKKRFPNIVIVEASFTFLALIVVFPTRVATLAFPELEFTPVASIICDFFGPAVFSALIFIEAMRMWLMYFQLKLMESMQTAMDEEQK